MAWVEYVRAEIDWLTPPAMACRLDDATGPNEGFRRMVHDQCYRWGERCWEDVSSFFVRQNFFREDVCDCRATYAQDGLKLSLREHDMDWGERKATWDKNRGTVNQGGFMRIYLDPQNTRSRIMSYVVWFEGCGGTRGEFVEYPNGPHLLGQAQPDPGLPHAVLAHRLNMAVRHHDPVGPARWNAEARRHLAPERHIEPGRSRGTGRSHGARGMSTPWMWQGWGTSCSSD